MYAVFFAAGGSWTCAADMACLAHILMLLDDSSPRAVVIDKTFPPSSKKISGALVGEWPRLAGRIAFLEQPLEEAELSVGDVVVSIHACGDLTDRIIAGAVAARARLAVLPCCHDFATCDSGDISGWVEPSLAIDITRATRLRAQGYRVWTQSIPSEITSKNRLLIAAPAEAESSARLQPGLIQFGLSNQLLTIFYLDCGTIGCSSASGGVNATHCSEGWYCVRVDGNGMGRGESCSNPRPDFELIVNAPAGETRIECVRGCGLLWVERGIADDAIRKQLFRSDAQAGWWNDVHRLGWADG